MEKLTLRQAVAKAVRIEGLDILRSPQRFIGCVMDSIDTESVEANILYSHCDERFLRWFANADSSRVSPAHLLSAYRGASEFLKREYGTSENAAHGVAASIALGIADAAGIDMEIEPQQPSDGNDSVGHGGSGMRDVGGGHNGSGNRGVLGEQGGRHVSNGTGTHGGRNNSRRSDGLDEKSGRYGFGGTSTIPVPPPQPPKPPMWPKVVAVCLCAALVVVVGLAAYFVVSKGESPTPAPWDQFTKEAPLTSPTVVSEDCYATDNGEKVMILTVRNQATSTVDMHASFSFLDAKGNAVEQRECDAWSVGPGEATLMEQYSTKPGVQKVSYEVTPKKPQYGKTSIASCVSVEELTCNSNGLTVRISNTSNRDVALVSCVAYGRGGHDDFSYTPVNYEGAERTLKPGESRNIAFGGSQWMDYDRKVYVYGYAD